MKDLKFEIFSLNNSKKLICYIDNEILDNHIRMSDIIKRVTISSEDYKVMVFLINNNNNNTITKVRITHKYGFFKDLDITIDNYICANNLYKNVENIKVLFKFISETESYFKENLKCEIIKFKG